MQKETVEKVREYLADGYGWERIKKELLKNDISELEATTAVNFVKKEKRNKHKNIGMVLLIIGSVICFFSMAYTFFFGHSYIMLYGLTILGVCIAFTGLVYILG